MSDVTELIIAIQDGNESAADELLPLVYDELRRLARARLAAEANGQTLQPTELVHEAYLRLIGATQTADWNGRAHFFGAAAEAMRRILVDRARRRKSQKRGGDRKQVSFSEDEIASPTENDDRLIELDTALAQFESYDPQKANYVKLRYFAGLTNAEASKAIGVSASTGDRYWVFARAWLQKTIMQMTK
ncbi:MAG: sigma-70 family RNA polymerase sigma factor [Pirellulaceae bacterium]